MTYFEPIIAGLVFGFVSGFSYQRGMKTHTSSHSAYAHAVFTGTLSFIRIVLLGTLIGYFYLINPVYALIFFCNYLIAIGLMLYRVYKK